MQLNSAADGQRERAGASPTVDSGPRDLRFTRGKPQAPSLLKVKVPELDCTWAIVDQGLRGGQRPHLDHTRAVSHLGGNLQGAGKEEMLGCGVIPGAPAGNEAPSAVV